MVSLLFDCGQFKDVVAYYSKMPMTEKIERDDRLEGRTYKIRSPLFDEALYVTINDAEVDDIIRPVEIFINSKNMTNFQWISCVTRLLSAQLRQSGKFPFFILDELAETYDPQGGYFIPKTNIWAPSVVAHIGYILKRHCGELGLLKMEKEDEKGSGNKKAKKSVQND